MYVDKRIHERSWIHDINELFNRLKQFIKTNPLIKSTKRKSIFLKNLESIKISIGSAISSFNKLIYSPKDEDIESSDGEYTEPLDLFDKG